MPSVLYGTENGFQVNCCRNDTEVGVETRARVDGKCPVLVAE